MTPFGPTGFQLPAQLKLTCQVCGDAQGDRDLVGCSRCAALHHLDCWLYLGRCATFGCGEHQAETARGLRVTLGLADQVDLCQAPPDGKQECDSCRKRWKNEKGFRCHTCGKVYHLSCWIANHGCRIKACRDQLVGPPAEVADLVSGLGRQNCPICVTPCKGTGRVLCVTCSRGYHGECWHANGGCTLADCRPRKPRDRSKVDIAPVSDEARYEAEKNLTARDLPVEAGTTLALLATWVLLCLALVFGF